MSNYSVITNFAAKDSLPKGDAGKVLRGAEISAEFNAIEASIATKQAEPSSGLGAVAEVKPKSGGGFEFAPSNIQKSEVVTLSGAQTLTGKTIASPTINGGTINNSTLNSPNMTNVSLQAPTIDDPTFTGTPQMSTAAKQEFARALGIMGSVGAELSTTTGQTFPSQWANANFNTISNYAETIHGETAAPGGTITVPQLCRWVECSVLVRINYPSPRYWRLVQEQTVRWLNSPTATGLVTVRWEVTPAMWGDVIRLQGRATTFQPGTHVFVKFH